MPAGNQPNPISERDRIDVAPDRDLGAPWPACATIATFRRSSRAAVVASPAPVALVVVVRRAARWLEEVGVKVDYIEGAWRWGGGWEVPVLAAAA